MAASMAVAEGLAEAEMEAGGTERSEPGDSEQDEAEDVFEVEHIIDMKIEKGEITYRVRWKGYTSEDDTWEPEAHLESCKEVLLAYQRKLAENKSKVAKRENQDEQGEVSTELTDVLADEPVTDASVLELGSPEKAAATASLKRGDTFSCSGENPAKLKAKQKKSKTQQPGEHRLKLQGIKNLINEKKGVRAESSQGKRESMQEKLNFLMETKSADAAVKTHKVSKSGTDDEPGFLSSDSNEGGSVVKRKIKNKALESTPKVSALKGKEENPVADKVSSVLTRHEDSEKEETFTANLFEKFLLNCEEKDRAPKRQSVCPPLVIVEEKVEQSKATPKTQVKPEKKTKTTKEVVPVQRPEPEKVDKSRREPRTPDNAKPMKGCFDVVSPPQEVDDARERREKAAVMSPGSEPPEETLFKWSGSAQRERRRKREDSEPRLYIA
ncbi:UNVERIFIED_CONTAM: hypothetical protein FKN15_053100 [Acipenser sinensis]